MAEEYNRPFGKPEDIEKRLAMWANSLARDRQYPWMGSGLVDDLVCASRLLGADPDKLYPGAFVKQKAPVAQEYDL